MKAELLNTAYLAEDGYVFECVNFNDFVKVLKAVSISDSSEEAMAVLNEKDVSVRIYKKTNEI